MVSQNLVIRTFYQYSKRPVFRKTTNTYNGECPYCHEGKSAGRKRRFFYMPQNDQLYCHNCDKNRNGLNFVQDMTNMSYSDIMKESEEHADTIEDIIKKEDFYKKVNPNVLPDDCINLFDENQVSYYKHNQVVKDALAFIKRRRLHLAANKPKALWLSLTDKIHKNRVIFPFYNYENKFKIDFYQSRALYESDEEIAKYLSKSNCDKTIFNIDNISSEIEYIFYQEGPIDSMFLRNSVALAGIHPTETQLETLKRHFPLYTHIYVLDNQRIDHESSKVSRELLENGAKVFIWPENLVKYKDLNDLCIDMKYNEIPYQFILKHTYEGMQGLLQLSQIKQPQELSALLNL